MKHSNKRGFTLMEMVMVIALLGIISLGLGNFMITFMRAWVIIARREAALSTSRMALNRVAAELRRIDKPQNITIHSTSECRFWDISAQQVDFKQDGSNLLRNSDILAQNLVSPAGLQFSYLDSSGGITAVTKNIRSIRVWLSLNMGTQNITLESSARIRNVK